MIAPEKYGWGSWAVDRNNSGYYIRNSYEATPGPSGYTGGFRVYAGEIAGYSIYSVDDITGDVIKYKYKVDGEGRYYQPVSIVTPDKTPQELLGLTYQELVWSVGGKSAADI